MGCVSSSPAAAHEHNHSHGAHSHSNGAHGHSHGGGGDVVVKDTATTTTKAAGPKPRVTWENNVATSNLPPIVLPNVRFTEFVLYSMGFSKEPNKVAIVEGISGATRTFKELTDQVLVARRAWPALGVGKGDIVTLMAPNHIDTFVAMHSVMSLGAAITPVNPLYTAPEVANQLTGSGSQVVIAHPMCLKVVLEAVKTVPVRHIVVLDGDDDELIPAEVTQRFSSMRAAGTVGPNEPAIVTPALGDDLVLLPYSSGTTGLPKGTMLTHNNLIANLLQAHEPEGKFFTADMVLISPLPLFHIYGFLASLHLPLIYGNTCVTMKRFDMERFCQLVQDRKCTRAQLVPPIVLGLAKSPIVDKYDLKSLQHVLSGAAPLGAGLVREMVARLPQVHAKQAWGMSELSPIGTMCADDDQHPEGSVGAPVASTMVKIVSLDNGEVLPVNGEGELWIRGPQVMLGYLNNPSATALTIDADGFLHTGDVAKVDANGFVFLTERVKELIKTKGFQVPPAELEALLITHPSIADAIVIPRPDEEAGELPRAYVVKRAGAPDVTADVVAAWVAERVAPHKRLKGGVIFVDSLPKTASGKLLRREVVKKDRLDYPV